MNFAHRYKLVKATPTHKAGSVLGWNGNTQRFYFEQPQSMYLDLEGPKYTVEQVQDKIWFRPVGRVRPFIPAFPAPEKLNEYVTLMGECRLVNDVDECRAINALMEDPDFQRRLYEFYKEQYECFHHL